MWCHVFCNHGDITALRSDLGKRAEFQGCGSVWTPQASEPQDQPSESDRPQNQSGPIRTGAPCSSGPWSRSCQHLMVFSQSTNRTRTLLLTRSSSPSQPPLTWSHSSSLEASPLYLKSLLPCRPLPGAPPSHLNPLPLHQEPLLFTRSPSSR